jgi:predicted  nucleic acid-binding Zn-ribbon protein
MGSYKANDKNMLDMVKELLEFIKSQVRQKANKENVQRELTAMQKQIDDLTQNLATLQARLVQSEDIRNSLTKSSKPYKKKDRDAQTGYLKRQNDDLRHQLELLNQRQKEIETR